MRSLFLVAALLAASPALAQVVPLSAPQPLPIVQTIPAARDVPYPGTMRLEVDASDLRQGIWTIRQTIPVAQAGRLRALAGAGWAHQDDGGRHGHIMPVRVGSRRRATSRRGQPLRWATAESRSEKMAIARAMPVISSTSSA